MKLYISLAILVAIILELVRETVTSSLLCPSGYNHCSNTIWCCPDGYICTGTSTCMSIGTLVGAIIGSLVGLAILIGVIVFCCRHQRQTRSPGTVLQPQPVVYNTGTQPPQYGVNPPGAGYGQPNVGYQPQPLQTKQ